MHESAPKVAAIVVTRNRREKLRATLQSIERQTRPVDGLFVMDNASSDGTTEMLANEFRGVCHVQLGDNLGPAHSEGIGIERASRQGFDWFWMFDDDAYAHEDALAKLLNSIAQTRERPPGILGMRNQLASGVRWRGRSHPITPAEISSFVEPYEVDWIDLNHTLISRELTEVVGVPRADFFMLMWNLEYCLRVKRAGFRIMVYPEILATHDHAGAEADTYPAWRGYYQTRNHLIVALENRSPRDVFWWGVRQVKFICGMRSVDNRRERLRLRALGAWHGLIGRTGRYVDPTTYGNSRGDVVQRPAGDHNSAVRHGI